MEVRQVSAASPCPPSDLEQPFHLGKGNYQGPSPFQVEDSCLQASCPHHLLVLRLHHLQVPFQRLQDAFQELPFPFHHLPVPADETSGQLERERERARESEGVSE